MIKAPASTGAFIIFSDLISGYDVDKNDCK